MARHLEKRRRRWYAILDIPKDVCQHFGGKRRLVRSLKTESLSVAERHVLHVVAEWKGAIAEARGGVDDMIAWIPEMRGDRPVSARALNRAWREAKTEEERDWLHHQIEEAAWAIGAVNVEHIGMNPLADPKAQHFGAVAYGWLVGFTDHLDAYLAQLDVSPRTKDVHSAAIRRFAASGFKTVEDVDRASVGRWLAKLSQEGLAPKTLAGILAPLRSYWAYLVSHGVVSEDAPGPFRRLGRAPRRARPGREPFAPSEVVELLEAAIEDGDHLLADLIRIAMFSGCRIEEICSLRCEDVATDRFMVKDAKTEAGRCEVPIHPELAEHMARLVSQSTDGFVLSGLRADKYSRRSNAIGKRFGALKTELHHGETKVFHSLRATVATLLENAGVAESVAADILGHAKRTLTYGLYSGGTEFEIKAAALGKIKYRSSGTGRRVLQ